MLTHKATRQKVIDDWARISATAARKGITVSATLPGVDALEVIGESTKTAKNEGEGALTGILYLPPATASGRNLCPWATTGPGGCEDACLVDSGQLSMDPAENARNWKVILLFGDRALFRALLVFETGRHERRALKLGLIPALRLDGTSDVALSDSLRSSNGSLAQEFPRVMFYGYTKSVKRALRAARGELGANRHLVFSYSGSNGRDASRVLAAGGSVAVAFRARPGIKGRRAPERLPARWRGYRVIDGDISDWRPGDSRGVVVGLRFKSGRDWEGKADAAGRFLQPVKGRRLKLASC